MKIFTKLLSRTLPLILLSACAEADLDCDSAPEALPGDRAATIEVPLRLHTGAPVLVGKPLVNDIPSRAEGDAGSEETPDDPEKAAEEAIHDIWVFQYDQNGNQLIMPRYYEVTSTEIKKLNIRLAEGVDSHVYVLANTCDPEWAKGKDFSTVEKFVDYKYPFTEDNVEMGTDEYLLMEGSVKETIRKETDLHPIDIHLTRMMAKISFKYVKAEEAKGLVVTRVLIHNMPTMMRMEETPENENYPLGDFETLAVTLDKELDPGMIYTFYMPANRRGTSTNTDPKYKNNGAPDKALYVQLFVTSRTNGSNFLYTIYLGANDYNDFNVRRNHNYNITLNLKSENRDDRVLAAPANCFVMNTGNEIMFDPYTRTEKGGGFSYSKYVNKSVPEKKIASVKILWQQANVIGNNSDQTDPDKRRVWLDEYDRVHVKAGTAVGNAVIAAYNNAGKILWSWHIWVNNESPANLDEAVTYYTFGWDNSGIKSDGNIRGVKGRSLMKCNLGAKSANPNATGSTTYGCVYQWGRKDPFLIGSATYAHDYYAYNAANIGTLYDNEYKAIPMTTNGNTHTTELFSTEKVSATTGSIEYVTEHPTHFISPVKAGDSYNSVPANHDNEGDWYWKHNDKLWGGKPYSESTKKYVVSAGCELTDNGATEKSIFDPCPAGWMVPPGDMWLGFTVNGKNASTYAAINSTSSSDNSSLRGYRMYVQEWKRGTWVYFPSQGLRTMGGRPWRNGVCGNYHTSSASAGGRVNIFHLHTPQALSPFETDYGYTCRAIGGPIRCVRDVDDTNE